MSTPVAQEAVDIRKRYQITNQHMLVLPSIVLLKNMIVEKMKFALLPEGEAKFLDPVFRWMHNDAGLVDLKKEGMMVYYVPSETGKKFFEQAHRRRVEFNQFFDIFCAVDITGSEPVFGFSKIFEYKKDDPAWKHFLAQERFEDLRVAVAEFKVNADGKLIDPVELVFMSFLKEGRFNSTKPGWEFDLLSGAFWKEVLQVCNSNLSWSEIGQEAMEVIINSGTELLYQLHEKERTLHAEDEAYAQQQRELAAESCQTAPHSVVGVETVEVVEEDVYEESFPLGYFDPYYSDPYYLSPAWEPLVFFPGDPVVVIW